MKKHSVAAVILILLLVARTSVQAQTDEIREATGLPIAIGQPVIYGRVSFRELPSGERKPTIRVTLYEGGSLVAQADTNDNGYFYFLREAVNGAVLVYEMNNLEIGRQVLMGYVGNRVRQDVEVDWRSLRQLAGTPSAIRIKDAYVRSSEAEKLFDRAIVAAKEKKIDEAENLYKKIIDTDPKDFVVWTELGTLYFSTGKVKEAEATYLRALDLNPKFMAALMNLGRLQLSQKQPDRAILTFTKAVFTDYTSADAFHYLGEAYLQIKVGSKAEIALKEAIRLAPLEKASLHLRLAALYDAAGAKTLAIKEYELLLKKIPNHPDSEKMRKYIKEHSK